MSLQTFMSFSTFNTKEDILKNVGKQKPLASIYFYFLLWNQWVLSNVWLPSFFQISSFVFNKRKKQIQVDKIFILGELSLYFVFVLLFLPVVSWHAKWSTTLLVTFGFITFNHMVSVLDNNLHLLCPVFGNVTGSHDVCENTSFM